MKKTIIVGLTALTLSVGPALAQTTTDMDRIETCRENFRTLFQGEALTGQGTDPELMDILQKFIFGEVFRCGELEMKTREMITCVCLATMQTLPQLKAHAAAALNAGVTPLATFEVVAEGDVQFSQISLTFSVGSRYAGAQATVYVVHSDGSQEAIPATVAADGTVTVTVDRLSVFSIVVDESTIPSGNQGGTGTTGGTTGTTGGTTTDTSATSPYTGAFLAPVAGMTAVAFAAAGGVSVVLRKKVNE